MQAISLWLAAAIVILTGWAIVKKYQVNMVLFYCRSAFEHHRCYERRDKLSSEECHCHRPFRL